MESQDSLPLLRDLFLPLAVSDHSPPDDSDDYLTSLGAGLSSGLSSPPSAMDTDASGMVNHSVPAPGGLPESGPSTSSGSGHDGAAEGGPEAGDDGEEPGDEGNDDDRAGDGSPQPKRQRQMGGEGKPPRRRRRRRGPRRPPPANVNRVQHFSSFFFRPLSIEVVRALGLT